MAAIQENRAHKENVNPTPWELEHLTRVPDDINWTIYLVAVAELAERFTYRSVTAPLQNYVQNAREDPLRPGALNMGQGIATCISFFYMGWTSLAPVIGAIVADAWIGRYWTIVLGTGCSWSGSLLIFSTSFPASLDQGAGLPGLLVALFLLGLGSGGIRSNVAPLIADQYVRKPVQVRTLDNGTKVLIDPDLTIQTIYGRYYWVVNLGPLAVIPASWLELKVSFWAAFMLPLVFWLLTAAILIPCRASYSVQKPRGSVILQAAQVFWLGLKGGFNLNAAKPSCMAETHSAFAVSWDDKFVDELRVALVACTVFCIFPVYWVCYGQMNNSLVSQAAAMETYGVPNDMMSFFNTIGVLAFIPIMEKALFPALQRHNIDFKPISRIAVGFVVIACAMGYSAGIQALIYKSPPCYDHPLQGTCSNGGTTPNNVNVFLQIPTFAMLAVTEILSITTGMEYAYTKAPKSMRSLAVSLFILMNAIGSALGIALSPISKDPSILIEFASLSGVMFLTAILSWVFLDKYNKKEKEMNKLHDVNDG
ncbi:oligopeptide transporter [Aspergillus pseudotamarii]|uniref:Oligopeptide transporter n=1 Tax=Aspergillus pseudotamarii TaxID=132259 RepID=A0A5N6TC77_ASPPS|nr:oligopeptide transporter [Aspergillus pseudotamarii]KAE8143877.1 oligopeptide transporter [Aspergillus pseudotamarii]